MLWCMLQIEMFEAQTNSTRPTQSFHQVLCFQLPPCVRLSLDSWVTIVAGLLLQSPLQPNQAYNRTRIQHYTFKFYHDGLRTYCSIPEVAVTDPKGCRCVRCSLLQLVTALAPQHIAGAQGARTHPGKLSRLHEEKDGCIRVRFPPSSPVSGKRQALARPRPMGHPTAASRGVPLPQPSQSTMVHVPLGRWQDPESKGAASGLWQRHRSCNTMSTMS